MSLADLSDGDGSDLADPKPILHFDSSPSDNRPTSAWGMDAPAPVVADVATAEKPGFLSSKFQQVALTVVCVVLILMAAAFAGAQLIFAAMDAGSRPRPIGIVVPERPAEGSTGTVLVFPSRR